MFISVEAPQIGRGPCAVELEDGPPLFVGVEGGTRPLGRLARTLSLALLPKPEEKV
jgi:hypothetical protein